MHFFTIPASHTFVKPIHVQLSHEGGDISMLEVLSTKVSVFLIWYGCDHTHARTFENSDDGDMTKLSLVLDHEIKCWML